MSRPDNEKPRAQGSEITSVRGRLRWLNEKLGRYASLKAAFTFTGLAAGAYIMANFTENLLGVVFVGGLIGGAIGAGLGEIADQAKRRLLAN